MHRFVLCHWKAAIVECGQENSPSDQSWKKQCVNSCRCEHLWWVQGGVCAKYFSAFHLKIWPPCHYWPYTAACGPPPILRAVSFPNCNLQRQQAGCGHFSRRKYLSHPSKEGRRGVGGRRWRLLVCSYGDCGGQRKKGEAGPRESGTGYRVRLLSNLSTQSLYFKTRLFCQNQKQK